MPDCNSAHQEQAACPGWVSTVPQLGKQRAQFLPKSVIRASLIILFSAIVAFFSFCEWCRLSFVDGFIYGQPV